GDPIRVVNLAVFCDDVVEGCTVLRDIQGHIAPGGVLVRQTVQQTGEAFRLDLPVLRRALETALDGVDARMRRVRAATLARGGRTTGGRRLLLRGAGEEVTVVVVDALRVDLLRDRREVALVNGCLELRDGIRIDRTEVLD